MPSAKSRLTVETVLDAAEALAHEVGPQQLSLTALAEKLGIRPPSLYTHISSLEDLKRLLALRAFAALTEVIEQAGFGKSQAPAVIAMANAIRSFARHKPGLYAFTLARPAQQDEQLTPAIDRFSSAFRRVLAGYELSEVDRIHTMRGLRSIVHGFVMLETSGAFKQRTSRDESFNRLLECFISGIVRTA